MASLVAYDDSNSDDPSDEGSPPVKCTTDSSNQENDVSNSFGLISSPDTVTSDTWCVDSHTMGVSGTVERGGSSLHPPSQPCFDGETRSSGGRSTTSQESFRGTVASYGFAGAMEKLSALQTPPHTPQNYSQAGLNTTRRRQTTQSGIHTRPYIPKRQRLTTPGQNEGSNPSVDNVSLDQTRLTQMLSEVSERMKPYLAHRPDRAEVPRRLLMSLEGHQGPVNTIQWCPVPHLSHLLLSASMDKTVKVWDGAESGRCLRVGSFHSGAVRDACWIPCGRRLLSGSFDNTAMITDVETGQQIVKVDNQFKVMCVAIQPRDPEVFLCGGHSSAVKAWDSRSCKVVKVYKAGIQQTLDILFLSGGSEFITSSDSVSRDSAERTLMAWDYQTTAKVSNQIYHERYTCPSLALHPIEESFVAQTNGNYMALFSSLRPYRMNKRRRYEGHKVEGYAVQCDFSQDGTILASGSSTGFAHFYDFQSTRSLHTLRAHSQPCLCVAQHPVLPATTATCDWGGEIKVWH